MAFIVTSVDQLPDYWRRQAVDVVAWRMSQVRAHAVARRPSSQPTPARARQPRRPQQPAARRPRWYLDG